MISKFYLFKKSSEERFIIGPKGFNNNQTHSLDQLVLWKFYNNHSHSFLLVSQGRLLATFTKSEKLISVLINENVPVKEIRMPDDKINNPNTVIKCEENTLFCFRTGDSLCLFFEVTQGDETIVSHNFLCKSGLNAIQQINKTIANMFTKSFEFISVTETKEGELPPEWMSGMIEGQVKEELKINLRPVFFFIIIVLIIIIISILPGN